MPAPFVAALIERPLLGDGAMGTMLYARGIPLDSCVDVLNASDPKIVKSIAVNRPNRFLKVDVAKATA
jgi:homocysteine S-methyltransferase